MTIRIFPYKCPYKFVRSVKLNFSLNQNIYLQELQPKFEEIDICKNRPKQRNQELRPLGQL